MAEIILLTKPERKEVEPDETDKLRKLAEELPLREIKQAQDAAVHFLDPNDPLFDVIEQYGNHPTLIRVFAAAWRGRK